MKKMLVKAVALSLVLGGVGFVANDAFAANIGPSVNAYGGTAGFVDVLGYEDGKKINDDVEQNKANIAKNADAIKTKADALETTKKFANVQEQLDTQDNKNKAQDVSIKAHTAAIKANKDAIKTKADAWETTKNFSKVQEQLDAQDNKNKAQDVSIKAHTAAIKANKEAIKANADAIEANKGAIKANADAIKTNGKDIAANKTAIETEVADRKAEVARLDGEVSRLDGRIDKLNDNVQKVGAMAAAIANLHTMGYDPEAPTEIAVGVGQYRDKTGMALGAFHYPNRDFMLSFSVSTAGDEFMGGIGATWKFGRKSPEELRQAEAEKAAKAKLAKAEAAKKAAKDARVAAQQKRHAEMLAARTGK